ncbi:sigma-54 dependent transcriptional regulator [bacterium]|nr:sigma-54 dependent transcriptional regulator [bacterium]
MATILVIDDDRSIRRALDTAFSALGHTVHTAGNIEEGEATWLAIKPDVIFLDLMLPDGNGFQLLDKADDGKLPGITVMITGHQDLEKAVTAMRAGAFDYIHKPLDLDELEETLGRALREIDLSGKEAIETDPDAEKSTSELVGRSRAIIDIHKQIGLASRGRTNVLVLGESGTGKELVARAIHRNTDENSPFLAINCSAFVQTLLESELFGHEKGAFTGAVAAKPGRFELAGEGTLFLDEIGDLDLALQAKLLRVLQERTYERVGGTKTLPFKARVIAATNRELQAMVADGRFREDLYYRLRVVEIRIPPLRDRTEDILPLVKHFLVKASREMGRSVSRIPEELVQQLERYHWAGNVRELENRVLSGVLLSTGDTLHIDLPETDDDNGKVSTSDDWQRSLDEVEAQHIARVLKATGRNLGKTCDILGISRPTLRRKIEEFNL